MLKSKVKEVAIGVSITASFSFGSGWNRLRKNTKRCLIMEYEKSVLDKKWQKSITKSILIALT